MICILHGPDEFSIQQKLKELKAGWDDEASLAVNTTVLDAKQLTLSELTNACNTVPFMGQKRLVIVNGLASRFEGGQRKSSSEEWQSLAEHTSHMPDTTVLVLIDGKIGNANPLLKKLAPQAEIYDFPLQKGPRLRQWIQQRIKQAEGSISPKATELLCEFGGENLHTLANEIDKLLLYADGRCIEEKDIRLLTSYTREANIFSMVDAIMEHRTGVAVRLLHQLLTEGAASTYILFMITRQFRLVIQAKDMSDHGTSPTEIGSRLGLSPNFPMDKLLRQATSYSYARLTAAYQELLRTDIAIKTGKQKDELALDLLVTELCR